MTISVDVRQVVGPQDAAGRDTRGLREGFLIEGLFSKGQINLTYSHLDRMIVVVCHRKPEKPSLSVIVRPCLS